MIHTVQGMPQVVIVGEWEVGKLAVDPASPRLHKSIIALKLREDVLLKHKLSIRLVIL